MASPSISRHHDGMPVIALPDGDHECCRGAGYLAGPVEGTAERKEKALTTLPHFPLVSQLTSVTSDGQLSEDAQFSCVPASIGACLLWYQGKTQWDSEVNPDKLKDAVYGQGYVGMMAASQYVPYCASLGYKLAGMGGANGAQLVAMAHQFVDQGLPVIFTEPDPYVSASLGWTHVCCFYGEVAGGLVALDPYIAQAITRSDAEWAGLLLNNEIWTLAKEETTTSININNPTVAAYFHQQDAQHWLCVATGRVIQYGILNFYCSFGGSALCGLTYLGMPLSDEIPIAVNATKQFFERGCVVYDPGHAIDSPPGNTGQVYLAHIYSGGPGEDPQVAKLQAQVATLQQELAAAPNGVELADMENRLAQINALSTH